MTVRLNKTSQEILEILQRHFEGENCYNLITNISKSQILEGALRTYFYIVKGEEYYEYESKNKTNTGSEDLPQHGSENKES